MVTDGTRHHGDHFIIYISIELLCGTPETITLYVNHISIKKKNYRAVYLELIQ